MLQLGLQPRRPTRKGGQIAVQVDSPKRKTRKRQRTRGQRRRREEKARGGGRDGEATEEDEDDEANADQPQLGESVLRPSQRDSIAPAISRKLVSTLMGLPEAQGSFNCGAYSKEAKRAAVPGGLAVARRTASAAEEPGAIVPWTWRRSPGVFPAERPPPAATGAQKASTAPRLTAGWRPPRCGGNSARKRAHTRWGPTSRGAPPKATSQTRAALVSAAPGARQTRAPSPCARRRIGRPPGSLSALAFEPGTASRGRTAHARLLRWSRRSRARVQAAARAHAILPRSVSRSWPPASRRPAALQAPQGGPCAGGCRRTACRRRCRAAGRVPRCRTTGRSAQGLAPVVPARALARRARAQGGPRARWAARAGPWRRGRAAAPGAVPAGAPRAAAAGASCTPPPCTQPARVRPLQRPPHTTSSE